MCVFWCETKNTTMCRCSNCSLLYRTYFLVYTASTCLWCLFCSLVLYFIFLILSRSLIYVVFSFIYVFFIVSFLLYFSIHFGFLNIAAHVLWTSQIAIYYRIISSSIVNDGEERERTLADLPQFKARAVQLELDNLYPIHVLSDSIRFAWLTKSHALNFLHHCIYFIC